MDDPDLRTRLDRYLARQAGQRPPADLEDHILERVPASRSLRSRWVPAAVAALVAAAMIGGLLLAVQQTRTNPVSKPASDQPVDNQPSCAAPSQLVPHPSDPRVAGPRAGDLMFLGFGASSSETRAVIHRFTARSPTKIVIQPVGPLRQPAIVQGWRCSDRSPLRFWYRGERLFSFDDVINQSTLATRGDLEVKISTAPGPPSMFPAGYPGSINFYSTGNWEISVRQGTQVYSLTISVLAD